MIVATEEGVVYTLRFGEVVFASGEELSAGVAEERGEGEDEEGCQEARRGSREAAT